MKTTGIIRRIDELGRIVIPKEIRKNLRIKNGESLEIYLENDSIILKKYSQIESLKNVSIDYVEAFNQIIKHNIIVTDRDKVIAATGPLKKKYLDKEINEFTERSIERRDNFFEKQKKSFQIINDEEEVGYYKFSYIVYCICNLSFITCIIFYNISFNIIYYTCSLILANIIT